MSERTQSEEAEAARARALENPDLDAGLEPEEEAGSGMTFLDHLEDLRWTLMKSFAAFMIAAALVLVFITQISGFLMWPYNFAVSGRELVMDGLINTSILGIFSVIFYLMLGGGLALSLPLMLYFAAKFVAPGLTERELKLVRPACVAVFFFFLLGAAFSYFVLLPAALRASIVFNDMLGFEPLWTAASYYGFMTWMVLGVGLAFEFPLVLMILVYLDILSVEQLRGFRRYSWVIFLGVAAIVTPTTDPVTFLLLAIPLGILYELAIVGSRRIERNKQEDGETGNEEGGK